jgi:hypothetical protein
LRARRFELVWFTIRMLESKFDLSTSLLSK